MKQETQTAALDAVAKWLMIPLGATVVVLGLVTFWLPLPTGLPLLLLGFLILLRYSVWVRRAVARASRRHPAFRALLGRVRGLRHHAGKGLVAPDSDRAASSKDD